MAVIECKNLTYVYGEGTPFCRKAVDNVNLSIEKGEFIGVIGHTGSGKSTLIQTLNGLLRPTSGQVLLDGKDIWEKPEEIRALRFRVGLVFQYPEYQLFEETVYKDISFGPRNMGLEEREIDARVREAALLCGVGDELLERSPFELSGGQRRRVAIAGVLAMQPEVLIMDEPTAGLDPRGRDEILSHVHRYHEQRGATVLLVSHSMEDVARHATSVLVMEHGKIAMHGSVSEVFSRGERLSELGLAVPQVTAVFARLARAGLPVPTDVFTVEQGEAALRRLLRERGVIS